MHGLHALRISHHHRLFKCCKATGVHKNRREATIFGSELKVFNVQSETETKSPKKPRLYQDRDHQNDRVWRFSEVVTEALFEALIRLRTTTTVATALLLVVTLRCMSYKSGEKAARNSYERTSRFHASSRHCIASKGILTFGLSLSCNFASRDAINTTSQ